MLKCYYWIVYTFLGKLPKGLNSRYVIKCYMIIFKKVNMREETFAKLKKIAKKQNRTLCATIEELIKHYNNNEATYQKT